ncbi:MAG: uroporphyrinogen decarboxylase family protein [Armatimonadota bacterium]
MDFAQHNAEQAAVWAAFHAGKPSRVPVSISCNPRMIVLDPALNTWGYSFKDCFENPAAMYDVELAFQYWLRHHLPCDFERGIPEQWTVGINFQNSWEVPWMGGALYYMDGEVPDSRPFLTDDNKRQLFDRGIPDPFSGILGATREYLDYFRERAAKETFHGRPVKVADSAPGLGADGIFTLACGLRGATEFCLDLYEDPEYAQQLLAFIVDATLARQRAWREYFGMPHVRESVWFADDSIALLSCEVYREMILPHHKRYLATDSIPKVPVNIHLCGDSSRHFVTMRDELGAVSFDTGFPIDHGKLRRELGPEVTIYGGPHVDLLLHGTPEEVAAETRRILHSGVMEGGKFVLKEANNLAPRTPMANLQAMYDTCKREGVYATAGV